MIFYVHYFTILYQQAMPASVKFHWWNAISQWFASHLQVIDVRHPIAPVRQNITNVDMALLV